MFLTTLHGIISTDDYTLIFVTQMCLLNMNAFFQLLKLPPHSDLIIVMEWPHPWPLCWVDCAACPNGLSCHLTAHNGQVLVHSMLHKYIYTSSMFQFITQFLNGLPSLASFLLSRKLNFQIFKKFKHNKMPCTINFFLWGCYFLATYR
jgi:hypothetical protein